MRKILKLISIVFLLILFNSCGSDKYDFAGDWVNTKNKSQIISIKQNGDSYLIEQNDKKYPAQMEGDFLVLNSEQKAVFNKENANLIINGIEYQRVNGDLFLGNWMTKNLSINISKKDDGYNVKYTRTYTDYQKEGNKEDDYKTEYKNASLNGYYSGSDEGGDFKITLYGNNKIRFYAETNATTWNYVLEKSEYVPQNGMYFNGVYQGINDASMAKLFVKRITKNTFKIKITGVGMDNIIWQGNYKDGFVYCKAKDVPGTFGISKGSLKFKLNNYIEVQGFWHLVGDDIFEFKKENNSNPNLTNFEKDNTKKTIEENSFFVINTTVSKTKEKAKREVEKLKNKGYNADYLWIPDYKSLSGAEFYSVYIGPFSTQSECEIEIENYRKIDNKAYALLVSQENKRVEIRGIGKVKIIEPYHK